MQHVSYDAVHSLQLYMSCSNRTSESTLRPNSMFAFLMSSSMAVIAFGVSKSSARARSTLNLVSPRLRDRKVVSEESFSDEDQTIFLLRGQ